MAKKKKSRVPPPPRTSQGPQQRAAGPQRRVESGGPRRLNLWFVALGVAIIVAAAIVGIVLATRGGSAEASGPAGPCTRATFPPMGRQHIEKLSSDFRYNSYPPTSGPHYPPGPKAPAVWNLYDAPVDETALVHNLEHGGVVVQYGADVPASTVAANRQLVPGGSRRDRRRADLAEHPGDPASRREQEDLPHVVDAPDDVPDLRPGRVRQLPRRLSGPLGRCAREVPPLPADAGPAMRILSGPPLHLR